MRANGPRSPEGGIYLGASEHGWSWTGPEHAALVIGPSRSGKTSSFIVPNVLAASGSVLSTSTKPDVLERTSASRRRTGWCMVFDPSGTVELPRGVHRVGWSPVAAAGDWDRAHQVASVMVQTARGRRAGAAASGLEMHWTERAAALLGPVLHAAALEGAPMRQVVHWVDRRDGAPALEVLSRRCGEEAVPTDVLAGILATDAREQSGIWSTASGVLAAYRSEAALASTEPPYLDADLFCRGRHTLYVCAPGSEQQLVAPLVVGLVSHVRDATYRRARHGVVDPPVLLALDEVANIAPLPDLPSLVTDGPGQGLLTLACLQDLSQARARWGAEAESFLSIFGTSAILGGIADATTLELVSALSGEHEVVTRSVARSQGLRGPQYSSTDSAVLRRRLPLDVVARGVPGWALTLDARNRVGWVRLTPSHRSALWEGLAAPGARTRAHRARGPAGRER